LEAMYWGRQAGFRYMNLGEAPLAEWHSEQHQEVNSYLMSLAFRHGRHFYSYQGLRNYKERFNPVWRPVYVAWPSERPLATVLSDIATAIGTRAPAPKKLGRQ
ncbi:MAG: phosphatidylglycerol lysyltransferase domain-containing protein, partial [Pirellulaceae bacterium]